MQGTKIMVGLLALIAIGAGWYAFRPERLFVNQKVNEALDAGSEATAPPSAGHTTMAMAPRVLKMGRFHKGSHETQGMVTLYELPNGGRTLRLTEFQTSNGPDVHVYLVKASDATDNATVTNAGFIDLASLKGNVGDQNYEIPADVNLADYHSVTIWCKRFGVNFGTAPLEVSTPAAVMSEAMPAAGTAGPRALLAGSFHGVSHETMGTATVYQLANGSRVLRLTHFETSNGPDVHVYFVAAADARDNATVTSAGFLDLASLKGNVGDQNYPIPSDVDLSKYRAVTIWCKRFGVNFATAPLVTPQS